MNGPISHNLAYLHSSGTSARDLVGESPKVTTDTNLTKGLERHGLDRTGLERIHDTKHEAESTSQPCQTPTSLALQRGMVLSDMVLKDIGLERSTHC